MVWLEAWGLWAPAFLAFAGALAPSLLAQMKLGVKAARGIALAALGALLLLTLVAFFTKEDATLTVLDLLLAAALVALAALGVRVAFAWALVVVAALAVAKGVGVIAMGFDVPALLGPALAGGMAWAAAALLGLALAVLRISRSTR